jgi:hypothetical protein
LIDMIGCGDIEAIFDGVGNHFRGLFPPLDLFNIFDYIATRPVACVHGDNDRLPATLLWFMLPVVTKTGLAALVAALDRGECVALFAESRELIDAALDAALPLVGSAHA